MTDIHQILFEIKNTFSSQVQILAKETRDGQSNTLSILNQLANALASHEKSLSQIFHDLQMPKYYYHCLINPTTQLNMI